jgi:hypothetical protein
MSRRRGDLDVIDEIAIPERLDDVVRKAEDQDVLHGLFAEVVVDAINLLFGQDFLQVLIELAGGIEVVAKGLFDDDTGPFPIFFIE